MTYHTRTFRTREDRDRFIEKLAGKRIGPLRLYVGADGYRVSWTEA